MPGVGGWTICTNFCSRFEMMTLLLASTMIAPASGMLSISCSPRTGPRIKIASSKPSAVVASLAYTVTDRVFEEGYLVRGSRMWWYRLPSLTNERS